MDLSKACEFTRWDKIRLVFAVLFTIYLIVVVIALILTFMIKADFNMIVGLIGVGFAVIGLAFSLASAVTTEREIRKVRDITIYNEDIRHEINLHAIEFKIRLNRIEEKIENSAINKNEVSKKDEWVAKLINEQKRDDSIFGRFHQLMEKWDNDGARWKKMGEVYMLIGAGATAIEISSFISYYDLSSWAQEGILQSTQNTLLQLFVIVSPGITIAGVGLAIYAFGVSLVDNQKLKKYK
jgi:fumarate reductase subunit C